MASAPARRPSVPIVKPKNVSGDGACAETIAAWARSAIAATMAGLRRLTRRTATVRMTLLERHDSRASGGLFRRDGLARRSDRVEFCEERRQSALLRIEETKFVLRRHAADFLFTR